MNSAPPGSSDNGMHHVYGQCGNRERPSYRGEVEEESVYWQAERGMRD